MRAGADPYPMPRAGPKQLAITGLILVIAAASGYWAYSVYIQAQLRKTVIALVTDTSQRLRDVITSAAVGTPAVRFDTVAEIDAHAAKVHRNYSELRALDQAVTFTEAADDYMLTSREILRRIAVSDRARLNLAVNSVVLQDHMRSDRGEATWPAEAVRLKGRVEQDYRDYRLAAQALVSLLDALPASQSRMAAHLEPGVLVDLALIASARSAVLETSSRLAAATQKLGNLETHR